MSSDTFSSSKPGKSGPAGPGDDGSSPGEGAGSGEYSFAEAASKVHGTRFKGGGAGPAGAGEGTGGAGGPGGAGVEYDGGYPGMKVAKRYDAPQVS